MSELIARLMAAIETPDDLTQEDVNCLLGLDGHSLKMHISSYRRLKMSNVKELLKDIAGLAQDDSDDICELNWSLSEILEKAKLAIEEIEEIEDGNV